MSEVTNLAGERISGQPTKTDRMRASARHHLAAALQLAYSKDAASIAESLEQATKARNVLIELEREMINAQS